MHPAVALSVYSGFILLGALGGALVPVLRPVALSMNTLLASAAGIMLGAVFFHMLPEAVHGGGYGTLTWVVVGFVVLLLLERFVLTHSCEEPPGCPDHRPSIVVSMPALVGLSVHTLFDGLALGSAIAEGLGLTAFIAIVSHKIPSSLSLATLLRSEGKRPFAIVRYVSFLALMVPVGAVLYFSLDDAVFVANLAPGALAFSSGTFLYIAVSDLLPHVNRHGRDKRLANLMSLGFGLVLMFVVSRLVGHPHG